MPQLSLYVTEENMKTLRSRAELAGMSMSKYANRLIEKDAEDGGWPEGFWDLYGALADSPMEVPEEVDPALDAHRDAVIGEFSRWLGEEATRASA